MKNLTLKQKLQYAGIALSTLLFIAFTIVLIVLGSIDFRANASYNFKMNFYNEVYEVNVELSDDNIAQLVVNDNGHIVTEQVAFLVDNGTLYIKPDGSSDYQMYGKIDAYTIKVYEGGMAVTLKCESSYILKTVSIIFLVIGIVGAAGLTSWVLIEKYLKNKKPQKTLEQTTTQPNKEDSNNNQ